MKGKLKQIYQRILADSESESENNGYLSWRGEWHAAAWGVSIGLLYALTNEPMFIIAGVGWLLTRAGDRKIPDYIPYPKQFVKESLYVIAHIPLGVVLGIVFTYLIALL